MPTLATPAIPAGSLASTPQPLLPVDAELSLRPWRLSDAEDVRAVFEDPEIQRWHVRRADSVAEARAWITRWQRHWPDETGASWAVVDAAHGTLLGRASLKSFALPDGVAEIAYWTAPAARGRGVCPRAVRALCAWALHTAGFHRLEIEHSTANPASCRVAAKAGFTEEGVRRGAARHADGWHDMHVHALVRGDG
ncbi:GNAT family N-acetyltransferase [Streptomyces sp. NPDC059009]|uniref:GNAT family N-acetyltransferase n=1 Tax=Streptomyces sp. NPDC059009 TaxID=3346694 RepID=UPI003694A822